ncbi:hypothetical protein HRbin37_02214 [bacterium HR37]|nr:hypothetical protein HRbin37_02214 [bacterium HR37]
MAEDVSNRGIPGGGKEESRQIRDIEGESVLPLWGAGIEFLEGQKDFLLYLEKRYLKSIRDFYKGLLDFGIKATELCSNGVDDLFLFQKGYVEMLKSIESRVLNGVLGINQVNARVAFGCFGIYLNRFKVFF